MTVANRPDLSISLAWLTPRVLIGAAVGVSLFQTLATIATWSSVPFDWLIFVEASERFAAGGLYDTSATYAYRYSPVLAPLLGVLGWIGPVAWRVLHVVAALALPSWPMRIVVLVSWPFWFDVSTGNIMVFTVLAAAWALRGNAFATAVLLAMSILIPRPLMLPLVAWLLWKRPEWRLPFAAGFACHALLALATGWADEWAAILLSSTSEMASGLNLAPSQLVGGWWIALALPLAAVLTWRGRLGWASLLAAPYWLPYYLLMPVLELDRASWRPQASRDPGARSEGRNSAGLRWPVVSFLPPRAARRHLRGS